MRPQNGHWSTVPLVAYHLLFWAFGLSYGPYLICIITLHLTFVVLVRVIARRAGVGPWIATIAASVLVLFGSGTTNILQSIQIGMIGSVIFGLCHLLCADHDGPFSRRDALGLVCGALAILASGIGTLMVVIVGMAVLIRRGWRMAALQTAPLAIMNGVWYEAERKSGYQIRNLTLSPLHRRRLDRGRVNGRLYCPRQLSSRGSRARGVARRRT